MAATSPSFPCLSLSSSSSSSSSSCPPRVTAHPPPGCSPSSDFTLAATTPERARAGDSGPTRDFIIPRAFPVAGYLGDRSRPGAGGGGGPAGKIWRRRVSKRGMMPRVAASRGLKCRGINAAPAELSVIHARDSCNYAARLRVTAARLYAADRSYVRILARTRAFRLIRAS